MLTTGLQYASPFAFEPHTLEYTCNKASKILDNTRSNLSKKRTLTTEETTTNEIIHQESVRFIKLAYGLVIEEFVSEDGQIHPREMAGELARKKGVYKARKKGKRTKAGCTNNNNDGMFGRISDQSAIMGGPNDEMSDEEKAEHIRINSAVYATLDECNGIVRKKPELRIIIEKITRLAPACGVNEDHFQVVCDETTNFLFELLFGSISLDEYGYAMEKFFHHGSDAVYNACKLPTREQNSEAIDMLKGVTHIVPIFTWPKHLDVLWQYIEDNSLIALR